MPELIADHTTLRLGGPAERWVRATTEAELTEAVVAADAAGEPVLVLGGGSNLVVGDDGFPGTVVEVATRGIAPDVEDDSSCWGGVRSPSPPARSGTTWSRWPSEGLDRHRGAVRDPGLGRRHPDPERRRLRPGGQPDHRAGAGLGPHPGGCAPSPTPTAGSATAPPAFKADPGRHVVLSVTFQLRQGDLGAPVAYAELARALGVELGQRAPLTAVREAVLGLRGGKGMVLDPADHDTWSAGSFFTNPVVDPDDGARRRARLAAARRAGQDQRRVADRARRLRQGATAADVALSGKHTLALTNRGGATTDELLALAREVRDGVAERFGIVLVNEPVLVGCEL